MRDAGRLRRLVAFPIKLVEIAPVTVLISSSPQPSTSYLVCATPRSGSTLLCEALGATGVAGKPAEYFEAMYGTGLPRRPTDYFEGLRSLPAASFLADNLPTEGGEPREALRRSETYRDYLGWVLKAGTTPNGVFGAKLMWGHVDHFVAYLRDLPEFAGREMPAMFAEIFPSLRYVRVVRRDKLRQSVSLWKALQTATWRAQRESSGGREPAEGREPQFSFDAIDYLQRQISVQEVAWTQYFEHNGIEPMTIVYEELTDAYERTLDETLDYLDVPPEQRSAPTLEIGRQADSLSDEWVERYQRGEYARQR
jgi:LPS sulfotransferase NodH